MNLNGEHSLADCLSPIWEGDFSYNESVFPFITREGTLAPLRLLYPIQAVTAVRSWDTKTLYLPEKDYLVKDGELFIPEGSSIPVTSWEELHPTEKTDASKEAVEGGYLLYTEHFFEKQILVSYTHDAPWEGPVPASKASSFARTRKLLEEGKEVKIHFYGDSITVGACATGYFKTEPNLPIWPELTVKALEKRYPQAKIVYTNTAVGGKCSRWATEESEERLIPYKADLVVIAFGMNDGPKSPDRYGIYNRRLIMDARRANPDCDILLVSTTLPNKAFKRFYGNQAIFVSVLKNLAMNYDNVEVADMTAMHEYLLTKKHFRDMSGNHINHPNDYLTRLYAQLCLQTLTGSCEF